MFLYINMLHACVTSDEFLLKKFVLSNVICYFYFLPAESQANSRQGR